MSILAEKESSIQSKTRELCEAIVAEESFVKYQAQVEKFLSNDEARLQYQSVHEMSESLNHKQRSGVELSDMEVSEFEKSREQLLQNSTVTDFMNAQKELQNIQNTIGKFVGATLELGRVPTESDLQQAEGSGSCCGGGGCGC